MPKNSTNNANLYEKDIVEEHAYNSQGEWDGIPILDTSSWPILCRRGKKQSPIWVDLQQVEADLFPYSLSTNFDQKIKNSTLYFDGLKLNL